MTTSTLDVPGAHLVYDVVGSGPPVVLVGLPIVAAGYAPLATRLAPHRTVITYDPRGFGRSRVDEPDEDVLPDVVADDVSALLRTVLGPEPEPVDVFGNSGGGVVALALAARYPELLRTVVSHEPPMTALLPDADEQHERAVAVRETFLAEGASAGFRAFREFCGFERPLRDPANPPPPPSAQDRMDGDRMLAHCFLPSCDYEPDLAALARAAPRLVLAAGAASQGQTLRRTCEALARALELPLTELPGDHGGFFDAIMGGEPDAFARALLAVLDA